MISQDWRCLAQAYNKWNKQPRQIIDGRTKNAQQERKLAVLPVAELRTLQDTAIGFSITNALGAQSKDRRIHLLLRSPITTKLATVAVMRTGDAYQAARIMSPELMASPVRGLLHWIADTPWTRASGRSRARAAAVREEFKWRGI
jgi:hypothetical protein